MLRHGGALVLDEHEIDLSGDGHYDLDRDSGEVALSFSNLSPVVAELVAELGRKSRRSEEGLDAFFEAVGCRSPDRSVSRWQTGARSESSSTSRVHPARSCRVSGRST